MKFANTINHYALENQIHNFGNTLIKFCSCMQQNISQTIPTSEPI